MTAPEHAQFVVPFSPPLAPRPMTRSEMLAALGRCVWCGKHPAQPASRGCVGCNREAAHAAALIEDVHRYGRSVRVVRDLFRVFVGGRP